VGGHGRAAGQADPVGAKSPSGVSFG
jgi:hypothetical protein